MATHAASVLCSIIRTSTHRGLSGLDRWGGFCWRTLALSSGRTSRWTKPATLLKGFGHGALTLTFASFVPYPTYALPRSSHPKPHETPSPVEGHKAKNLKPRTFKRKLLRPKARAVTFLNVWSRNPGPRSPPQSKQRSVQFEFSGSRDLFDGSRLAPAISMRVCMELRPPAVTCCAVARWSGVSE